MKSVNRLEKSGVAGRTLAVAAIAALLFAFGWGIGLTGDTVWAEKVEGAASQNLSSGDPGSSVSGSPSKGPATPPGLPERIEAMEHLLQKIRGSLDKAEPRSYEVKMMGRQLIRILTVGVILLFVIAFAIPISVWLLGRSKLLGLPADVAATLLSVEERQAKLVSTFKEIQDEMDELHSQSGPDLKNLVKRAEEYLSRNEQELKSAGRVKSQ